MSENRSSRPGGRTRRPSSDAQARTEQRQTEQRLTEQRRAAPRPVMDPANWQDLLGGRTPTPVQAGAIPALLAGKDVITTARTGSGKTLAFLIPAAARGIGMSEIRGMRPEVLVITPTRELAVQIRDVARELGMTAGRITGGITPGQTRSEATGKGVIAGTPGRLKDLVQKNELSLAGLKYVVLTSVDRDDLPDEAVLALARSPEADIRLHVASAEGLSPAVLDTLITDSDANIRTVLAVRPDLTPTQLEELATDDNAEVRRAVAYAAQPGAAALARLSADPNAGVRRAVARHPDLTPDMVLKLAGDPDDGVRLAVAGRADLSGEVRAGLQADPDPSVREEAGHLAEA